MLTTHHYLVPRLRISGAITLLPSYMPSWRGQGKRYLFLHFTYIHVIIGYKTDILVGRTLPYNVKLERQTFRLTFEGHKLFPLSIITSPCIKGSDSGRYPS